MNALTSAALLASTSISTHVSDDAELIRVCDAHAAKIVAVNSGNKQDAHPDWAAYFASVDFINETKATTLAGLLAKARAAKGEAMTYHSDGSTEHWENCPAESWAPDVCNELLDLFGSATLSPDTDLIEACGEYLRIQREFEAYYDNLPGDMASDDPGMAILYPVPSLVERIVSLRATTAAGHVARGRCMAFHNLPSSLACNDDPDRAPEERFRAAGLRDLVHMERGAVGPLPLLAAGLLPHPDAELIAVCAEFDACERQTSIIHGTGPECVVDDDEANVVSAPVFRRMHVLLDRMEDLRATTPAGIQARAHCLALHAGHGGYSFDCEETISGRLLHYLMRDSAALAGSPLSSSAAPDAELLEACAAFDQLEHAYVAACGDYAIGSRRERAAQAKQERAYQAQRPLVARMVELRAVTREGQAARARSLALWDAELMKDGTGDTGVRLTAAIVRDLIAGSAGA